MIDTATMENAYRTAGYVAVPNLLAREDVELLCDEAAAIARGARGAIIGASADQQRGDLDNILAIHFPHKVSDLMRRAMVHRDIIRILARIIGPDIKAVQTMLFVKKAGKPGQAWHQDEQFIPTRDRSLCGVWIALDDATEENGCLWMHPGSHEPGILYPMRPHADARFDLTDEAFGFGRDREGGVSVPLAAGGVAFFNGYTLHRSLPNRAPRGFRRALVIHYMNARSLLPWTLDGRIATEDLRDIELVAGVDPYAWKGRMEMTIPYVRPDDGERAMLIERQLVARMEQLARALPQKEQVSQ